jgi:hypothetical protein
MLMMFYEGQPPTKFMDTNKLEPEDLTYRKGTLIVNIMHDGKNINYSIASSECGVDVNIQASRSSKMQLSEFAFTDLPYHQLPVLISSQNFTGSCQIPVLHFAIWTLLLPSMTFYSTAVPSQSLDPFSQLADSMSSFKKLTASTPTHRTSSPTCAISVPLT